MSQLKLPPVPPSLGISITSINGQDQDEATKKPVAHDDIFANGPSYTVKNVKHQLPKPSIVRPYVDRVAGTVDTWPAHAAQPFAPGSRDAKDAAKPKFLQQLENFLQRELRALGCEPRIGQTPASEKRLQAFREVFEYLIDDFKTYKPLLSQIKSEYENLLTCYREKIRDLEPLKSTLVTVSEKCEQKILNLRHEEREDMKNVKLDNARLKNIINDMKIEQVDLQEQVKKCQEEISFEYKRYRDESDARKLLIADVNDMKYQQDEAKRALAGASEEDDESAKREDAVMLRIALKQARHDLDLKTQKLAEVMADYGDVVPRRDFEKLENDHQSVESELETLQKDHETLVNEHSVLIEVHRKVLEQRDTFSLDCERMRRSATPRPEWDKVGVYLEGGADRWDELAEGTTSAEKMELLLAEMTGQDVNVIRAGDAGGAVEFFEGHGSSETVPPHLRMSGQIRNRRMSKRDAAVLVKQIWQNKLELEAARPPSDRSTMSEFVHSFFTEQYGEAAFEWSYNLQEAVTSFDFDSGLKLFSGVLADEINEEVYYENLSNLEKLYKLFAAVDEADEGTIPSELFEQLLEKHFTLFSSTDIKSLVEAAKEELGEGEGSVPGTINYADLFTEDDEGRTGPFIQLIQKIESEDKINFIQEIISQIGSKSDASYEDVKAALRACDPALPDTTCDVFATQAFRGAGELTAELRVDLRSVQKNLLGGTVRRHGRK